jgi:hypothetical protein
VRKPKPDIRRYAEPVFRFKRYKRIEDVVLQSMYPPGKDLKWKLEDIKMTNNFGEEHSAVEYAKQLTEMGVWGFADTRAKPYPVIHYWHDGKRTERQLVFFFCHEMGHCVGRPAARGWPEENRADDYGAVALLALEAARKERRSRRRT